MDSDYDKLTRTVAENVAGFAADLLAQSDHLSEEYMTDVLRVMTEEQRRDVLMLCVDFQSAYLLATSNRTTNHGHGSNPSVN